MKASEVRVVIQRPIHRDAVEIILVKETDGKIFELRGEWVEIPRGAIYLPIEISACNSVEVYGPEYRRY